MAFTNALYYPSIDITDENWLKTSVLYWESIRTIVPETIKHPYSEKTSKILYDEGFLIPLKVNSEMEEIINLSDDIIKYFKSPEASSLFTSGNKSFLHRDKMPGGDSYLRLTSRINSSKLPYILEDMIKEYNLSFHKHGDWYLVDSSFSDYYMTLLATRLSERIGVGLLTPSPFSDRLALSAKIGLPDEILRQYDAWGERINIPPQNANGMLANIILEKINIHPDTPIKKLIEYRLKHSAELGRFRNKIADLTSCIKEDIPFEHMRQKINDIYINDVNPAINDLKNSLKSIGIKSISDGILKTALISIGSSSLLSALGLAIPVAFLAGTGISITAQGIIYNHDKADKLLNNPYSYLLSLENAF